MLQQSGPIAAEYFAPFSTAVLNIDGAGQQHRAGLKTADWFASLPGSAGQETPT